MAFCAVGGGAGVGGDRRVNEEGRMKNEEKMSARISHRLRRMVSRRTY